MKGAPSGSEDVPAGIRWRMTESEGRARPRMPENWEERVWLTTVVAAARETHSGDEGTGVR